MTIVEVLTPLLGSWQGVNKLRLLPTDEYQESTACATVSVTAQHLVTIAYTWADGGKPQDGLFLLGGTSDPNGATAVWVDSFHSAPAWMTLPGDIGGDGLIRLIGSYGAPTGPDWGWQVHIAPGTDGWSITMHNVVPGEAPYQAVETTFDRRGDC